MTTAAKKTIDQMAKEMLSQGLIEKEVRDGENWYKITDKGMRDLEKELKVLLKMSLKIAKIEYKGSFDEAYIQFEQSMIQAFDADPITALMSVKYDGEDMLVRLAEELEKNPIKRPSFH